MDLSNQIIVWDRDQNEMLNSEMDKLSIDDR
jgi:hypothetical protein